MKKKLPRIAPKKRRKAVAKEKVKKVMKEFKQDKLTIGKSDKKVTNPKQAIAIALSEARKKAKEKKRGR